MPAREREFHERAVRPPLGARAIEMDELATMFAIAAQPVVEKVLREEAADAGAEAWREEADLVLGTLLHDRARDSLNDGGGAELVQALQRGLREKLPPDEDEVREHATEVGRVLAAAWVQFLLLALDSRDALALEENDLLPSYDEVREELWHAWRSSLHSLPVDSDSAPDVMRGLAKQLAVCGTRIKLPAGLQLDQSHGGNGRYVVQRS